MSRISVLTVWDLDSYPKFNRMHRNNQRQIGQLFLPLFLIGLFLCPCRGFGALIATYETVDISCCEHCAHQEEGDEAPEGTDADCHCTVGCCQSYVIPDSNKAQVSISPVHLDLFWTSVLPVEMLPNHPQLMEGDSDPPQMVHRGALFPSLTHLLI